MKSITLQADDRLIDTARQIAAAEHTTLEAKFREWLENYAQRRAALAADNSQRPTRGELAIATLRALRKKYPTDGRKFTREEMNERGQANTAETEARRRARHANWDAIRKTASSGGRKFTRDEMNER